MNSKISGTRKIEDRLSSLPDGVLTHILSFLPTKFAATTSVLSKRWRFLFPSVSQIDLEESPQPSPRLRLLFHQFLHRLLIASDPTHLHRFRLKCTLVLPKKNPIHNWIRAAISRRVQQLDISVSIRRSVKLPTDIYHTKSLNSLTLCGDFIFHVPSSVQIPNLMNLHLESVIFTDVSCFRRAFPALKHLRLSDCKVDGNEVIEIVSPSLVKLNLHRHSFGFGETLKHLTGFKVSLYTPNLECFEYSSNVVEFVEIKKNMSFLARADIDFRAASSAPSGIRYDLCAKKIIEGIQNVRALRLSEASLYALHYFPPSWPTFHNLIVLKLGVNLVGWEVLAKSMESSPNLEVLDFDEGLTDRRCNRLEFEYSIPKNVPVCLSKNIRHIKMADFCGRDCELELVEYFLRSGKALEEIRIRSLTFWDWPSFICERLLAYQRCAASKTCKIILSWKSEENFRERILN